MKQLPQQTRADHLARCTAAEVQQPLLVVPARQQRYEDQMNCEVEDVAQIVAPADRRHGIIENDLLVLVL